VRRGIAAAMASPRNWLGKKEDKEGTRARARTHTHAHATTHTHAHTHTPDRCVLSAN
jgi:hypothetical protein